VRHLKRCVLHADAWPAFAEVLPPERHIVGRAHTAAIERDNSNTRHRLAGFTRRTKVVSKKAGMVDLAPRLWQALTSEPWFTKYRTLALSIYR
jgi:IS1 family transposase